MKILRKFGMAMMSVLMGISLVSCSKENDPTKEGDENSDSIKKLTQFLDVTDAGSEYGWILSYDTNGKLKEAQFKGVEGGSYTETYKFSWDSNIINIRNTPPYTYAYTVEDGVIESYKENDSNTSYCYNYLYFSGRLEKINRGLDSFGKTQYTTTVWDEDKLVEITNSNTGTSEFSSQTKISYGESCKNGYCPLIPYLISFSIDSQNGSLPHIFLYMAHPELIGARSTQLPNTVTTTDRWGDIENENITYEFDNDGYISKIKIINSKYGAYAYTLTWE